MAIQQFDINKSYLIDAPELHQHTNDLILSDTESIISHIEEEDEIMPIQVDTKNIKVEHQRNTEFQQYFKDVLTDIDHSLKIEPYTKTSTLVDDDEWGWEDDLSITNTYFLPNFIVKLIEADINNKKMFRVIIEVLLVKIYKMYRMDQFKEIYRLLDYGMDNEQEIVPLVKGFILVKVQGLVKFSNLDNVLKSVDMVVSVLPLDDKLIHQNELLVHTLSVLEGVFESEVSFLVKRKVIEWYKENKKKMSEDVLVSLNNL